MNKVLEYKISVIVPCYSVGAEFLGESLESIKKQTYNNWEIILVDDCSPQQEWKIEIVSNLIKDQKLKLIHNKKNLGLAVSRNIGFDNSNGDIVLFLDSDDKYSKNNFFEYLNQKFQEFPDLDVLHFQFQNFLWNQKKQKWNKKDEKNKFKNKYFKKAKIEDFVAIPTFAVSAWIKAYKKSFLIKNNIRHLEKNTFYEDWVFWFQVFSKNPNIFLTNEQFYLYRKRPKSIMWETKKNKNWDINSLKIIKKDIDEYISKSGYETNLNQQKIQFLSYSIFLLIIKYGIKKCERELGIDKKDLKQILYKQKKNGLLNTKFIINLKIVGRIIFWIYLYIKK